MWKFRGQSEVSPKINENFTLAPELPRDLTNLQTSKSLTLKPLNFQLLSM
jgi:hypothetical protein